MVELNQEAPEDPKAAPQNKQPAPAEQAGKARKPATEIGGPKGLEPTRFGDWEKKGRCIDF
jgi:hypothetical protein